MSCHHIYNEQLCSSDHLVTTYLIFRLFCNYRGSSGVNSCRRDPSWNNNSPKQPSSIYFFSAYEHVQSQIFCTSYVYVIFLTANVQNFNIEVLLQFCPFSVKKDRSLMREYFSEYSYQFVFVRTYMYIYHFLNANNNAERQQCTATDWTG